MNLSNPLTVKSISTGRCPSSLNGRDIWIESVGQLVDNDSAKHPAGDFQAGFNWTSRLDKESLHQPA